MLQSAEANRNGNWVRRVRCVSSSVGFHHCFQTVWSDISWILRCCAGIFVR